MKKEAWCGEGVNHLKAFSHHPSSQHCLRNINLIDLKVNGEPLVSTCEFLKANAKPMDNRCQSRRSTSLPKSGKTCRRG